MDIKKDITFIYSDSTEYQMMKPIAMEAEQRGYTIRFSDNPFVKCNIGFYCQHSNLPQNALFSIVTLHDLGQSHGEWPNIWFKEPWNIYDLAFLPSNEWADMWRESSKFEEANPRLGVYNIGWTKADCVKSEFFIRERDQLIKQLNLNPEYPTVLYAPSWENDHKQDDFVSSLKDLKLNLIIKQAPYDPKLYSNILRNIEEMNALHNGIENVYILDSSVNIFHAISICDVMVSEESSTMFEAMLMDVPSIAIEDWLIPDTTPHRQAIIPYKFVYRSKKIQLKNSVLDVLHNINTFKQELKRYKCSTFRTIDNSSKVVMDMIEYNLYNICSDVMKYKIEPLERVETPSEIRKTISKKIARTPIVMKLKRSNCVLRSVYNLYSYIKWRKNNEV